MSYPAWPSTSLNGFDDELSNVPQTPPSYYERLRLSENISPFSIEDDQDQHSIIGGVQSPISNVASPDLGSPVNDGSSSAQEVGHFAGCPDSPLRSSSIPRSSTSQYGSIPSDLESLYSNYDIINAVMPSPKSNHRPSSEEFQTSSPKSFHLSSPGPPHSSSSGIDLAAPHQETASVRSPLWAPQSPSHKFGITSMPNSEREWTPLSPSLINRCSPPAPFADSPFVSSRQDSGPAFNQSPWYGPGENPFTRSPVERMTVYPDHKDPPKRHDDAQVSPSHRITSANKFGPQYPWMRITDLDDFPDPGSGGTVSSWRRQDAAGDFIADRNGLNQSFDCQHQDEQISPSRSPASSPVTIEGDHGDTVNAKVIDSQDLVAIGALTNCGDSVAVPDAVSETSYA